MKNVPKKKSVKPASKKKPIQKAPSARVIRNNRKAGVVLEDSNV
jgi:hypothetical protein